MEVTHPASRPHAWQGLVKEARSANHLAMKKGLGQGWPPSCLGHLSLPRHQQQSNSGPPLAWAVPFCEVGSKPSRGLRT